MNSRFAVATHILTLLYSMGNDPLTSEFIAGSVNTNPVVIRRLLSVLNKAGLTTGRLGAGGGATLARPATAITLLDVHRAVGAGEISSAGTRKAPTRHARSGGTFRLHSNRPHGPPRARSKTRWRSRPSPALSTR